MQVLDKERASTSREKILLSAIKVIADKGFHGAKMEEIAKNANLNKAMLYYIFKNKKSLHIEVFKRAVLFLTEAGNAEAFEIEKNFKDDPLKAIKEIIKLNFTVFSNNKDYSKIILEALSLGLETKKEAMSFLEELHNSSHPPYCLLFNAIDNAIKKKLIRDVDKKQLELTIVGSCTISFLSSSFYKYLNLPTQDEEAFIKNRAEAIVDLIINGLVK